MLLGQLDTISTKPKNGPWLHDTYKSIPEGFADPKVYVCMVSCVWFFATPWTMSHSDCKPQNIFARHVSDKEFTRAWVLSHSAMSNSVIPWPVAIMPWDSPGKETKWVSISTLGIFPTQGSNLHLLHGEAGSLPLSYLGSPKEFTDGEKDS